MGEGAPDIGTSHPSGLILTQWACARMSAVVSFKRTRIFSRGASNRLRSDGQSVFEVDPQGS